MMHSPARDRYHHEADLDTWIPVSFYERKIVSPDPVHRYRYEPLDEKYSQFGADLGFPVNFPPTVGDWIIIGSGSFRVIDRQWMCSGYGSTYWPTLEDRPVVPHRLTLILERSTEGPFAWEAESEEEA